MGLRHKDYGELETLRAVDGEQPNGLRVVQDGLSLPGGKLVSPAPQVSNKLVQGVVGQSSRQAHELTDVGESLVSSLQRGPSRLEPREGQGALQEGGGRIEGSPAPQVRQHLGGAHAAGPDLLGDALRRVAKHLQ